MDGAQNRLAVVCELLEQRKDRPGGLTIQARRRLIKEKKQLRLCCQLDSYGEALALLDVET